MGPDKTSAEEKSFGNSQKQTPDPLQEALEKSVHELLLLAKLYDKHGFYQQAQEIYYYILSIQARRGDGAAGEHLAKELDTKAKNGQEKWAQAADWTSERPSEIEFCSGENSPEIRVAARKA